MTILEALNSLYNTLNNRLAGKQDSISAGDGISISGNTVSVKPTEIIAKPSASISISAGAVGTGLTYQWEISTNLGRTWTNSTAASATTDTMSTTATTGRNGYMWRCKISGASKTATTLPVKLVVLS